MPKWKLLESATLNVIDVAIGASLQVCALFDNNQIKCWGNNVSGELGINSADGGTHPTPLDVTVL